MRDALDTFFKTCTLSRMKVSSPKPRHYEVATLCSFLYVVVIAWSRWCMLCAANIHLFCDKNRMRQLWAKRKSISWRPLEWCASHKHFWICLIRELEIAIDRHRIQKSSSNTVLQHRHRMSFSCGIFMPFSREGVGEWWWRMNVCTAPTLTNEIAQHWQI